MLVTLNDAAFVFIMLRVCVVPKRVERVEYEWDGAPVGASPPWLPIPFPHPAIPTTRKHTTMINALPVQLLRNIENTSFLQYNARVKTSILAWEGNRAFLLIFLSLFE